MSLTIFLGSFIILWFSSMVIQTYVYFSRNGLSTHFLGFLYVPILLFSLHFKVLCREKDKKTAFKFLLSYFENYKLSLIFLTELLLENIAITNTVGNYPMLVNGKSVDVEKIEKEPLTKKIKNIIKLPNTSDSFKELLLIA